MTHEAQTFRSSFSHDAVRGRTLTNVIRKIPVTTYREVVMSTVADQVLALPLDSVVMYEKGHYLHVLQRTGFEGWLDTRGEGVYLSNSQVRTLITEAEPNSVTVLFEGPRPR